MIRRARPVLQQRKKFLIVCEGEVTERLYIEGVRQAKSIPREFVILVCAAGDPKRVVDRAVLLKEENDARARAEELAEKDEVWCVFDRDEHLEIPEAKQKATANNIKIAFSNPCFELFLLLHFETLEREEHRRVVARLLRRHIRDYDKHFDYSALSLGRLYPVAKTRVLAINARSTLERQIERPPYCSVPSLIDTLNEL